MRQIRRLDPGVRARARRARICSSSRSSIRRSCRCPRSTTSCVVWMVTQHKSRMVLYAARATARIDRRAASCCTTSAARAARRSSGSASAPSGVRPGAGRSSSATACWRSSSRRCCRRRRRSRSSCCSRASRRISAPASSTAIAIGRGIRYFGEGLLARLVRRPGHRLHPREQPRRSALVLRSRLLVAGARRLPARGAEQRTAAKSR